MDTIKIGKFIAELRKEKGLTQKELGECLDVSDKTVSKWERGVNLPDPSLYFPLCDKLGVSVNELFAGEKIEEDKMLEKSEENIVNIMNEQSKKQKRLEFIGKVIKVLALCLVPLIVLQWNLKLIWGTIDHHWYNKAIGVFFGDPYTNLYSKVYCVAYLYFVAYFLVLKKIKFGYYLMWMIYIFFCFVYLIVLGTHPDFLINSYSVDFWVNIILMIMAVVNKEVMPVNLFKKAR